MELRNLTEEDMLRMRLPRRFWEVTLDEVPSMASAANDRPPQDVARDFCKRYEEFAYLGLGLLLHGPNGTGKTGMAAVIAKQVRRMGYKVLFIEAARIPDAVINGEMFDDTQSMWDRAMTVDLLVIDDFGKGIIDSKAFRERKLDELLRHRSAEKRVSIMTTNMAPGELSAAVLASTMSTLKECMVTVPVTGADKREGMRVKLARELMGKR